MRKQFITLIVLLTILVFFLPTSPVHAQTLLPFGGLTSFPIPCTCSGTLWVWFTPLYLGGPVVISGPVIYSPFSSLLFAYYMIGTPGTWNLGSYIPGAQACWMIAPPPIGCFPLPATGLMFMVGTNKFF